MKNVICNQWTIKLRMNFHYFHIFILLFIFILYRRRCINCENTNYQRHWIGFLTGTHWVLKVNKVKIAYVTEALFLSTVLGIEEPEPRYFLDFLFNILGSIPTNQVIIRLSCLDILYKYSLSKMFKSVQFSPVEKKVLEMKGT